MPFTVSHAAIVLPFSRLLARWRLLSAVIIGAMVPDFGLFFPWRIHRFETHSTLALLTFCLPVGIGAYWVFQFLIKTPILEALPDGAHARWRQFASPADVASIRQWMLAAVGVLAGAVTHLVWDAFTHENARGVRMIPWLEDPVVDFGAHHVSAVRLLQDGSSLLGLVVVVGLVWYGLRAGTRQPAQPRPLRPRERRAWAAGYAVACVGSGALWWLWARYGEPLPHSITAMATGIAVAGLRGLATGLLCTSLVLDWRLHALRSSSAHRPPPTAV
jgi:Domain of unknown function (DUF4184)